MNRAWTQDPGTDPTGRRWRGTPRRRTMLVAVILVGFLSVLALVAGPGTVGSPREERFAAAFLLTFAAAAAGWTMTLTGENSPSAVVGERRWARVTLVGAGLSLGLFAYLAPDQSYATLVAWLVVLQAGAGRLRLADAMAVGAVCALATVAGLALAAGGAPGPGGWLLGGLILTGSTLSGLILTDLREERLDVLRYADELAAVATVDPLTGLPNRRALEERLQAELTRGERYGEPFSLAMLDLDGFKAVNDARGHAAGDELLASTAELIEQYARDVDYLCRYGGDEFAMVLPSTRVGSAWDAVERARMAVERRSGRDGVTLSAGVAGYPEHGRTASEVLRAADRGLYRSKLLGRNRVRMPGEARKVPTRGRTEHPTEGKQERVHFDVLKVAPPADT